MTDCAENHNKRFDLDHILVGALLSEGDRDEDPVNPFGSDPCVASARAYGDCGQLPCRREGRVGNWQRAYRNVPRLTNPANDAADVSAALKSVGFETILATDLDKTGMDEAAIRFSRAAQDADIALLYYSGHALQFGGANYLAPIDTRLTDVADLRRLVRLDDIVADLQQAKNLRILVLDACRDNPFANELRRSLGTTGPFLSSADWPNWTMRKA